MCKISKERSLRCTCGVQIKTYRQRLPRQPIHAKEIGPSKKHVKKAEKEPDSSTSSDDESFKQTTAHLEEVKKVRKERKTCKTVTVRIDDVDV
jgi:hypothetical protein